MAATPESPQATIPSTIAAVARAATMTVPQCRLQQLERNTATMTAIQATTAAATVNMVAATNTMTDIKNYNDRHAESYKYGYCGSDDV